MLTLHSEIKPSLAALNSDVILESLMMTSGELHVVRDDYLRGGTKQRAILPFLQDRVNEGYTEFVYASPFCGFAQIALAAACEILDLPCRLFCELDPTSSDKRVHAFSLEAQSCGAKIVACENLSEATQHSVNYVATRPQALVIPLGFDCDGFRDHLSHAVTIQWALINGQMNGDIRALWLPIGSGTLLKTFRQIVPVSIPIFGVNVHVLSRTDARIQVIDTLKNVNVIHAGELFSERARVVPPIPSNSHYDAKLWSMLQEHAGPRHVWWNVAR